MAKKVKKKQKQSQRTSVTVNINTKSKSKSNTPRATNGNTNRVFQQFTQSLITLPRNKIDYLKRIYYVVNNGDGYAREAESARARRAH